MELHCSGCQRSWSVIGGVPHFTSGSAEGCETPLETLRQINELSQRIGWRKAVSEKIKGEDSALSHEMTDEARADFRFVLPMTSRSKVLEIGAGFGAVSFGLQPHCGWIAAVEPVAERARFMEIRRSQEELQNIEVAVAGWFDLPFSPETFDFIIVNGVLKSVGLAGPAGGARSLQVRFLSDLLRLLRPGGAVYIGSENRLDMVDLRKLDGEGRPLPEMPKSARSPIKGKVYGKEGYRKLLAESGFSEVQFFMPYPDYTRPATMISLDDPEPLKFFLNHSLLPASNLGGIKKRIVLWGTSIGLSAFIPADFSIIAWKEGRYD